MEQRVDNKGETLVPGHMYAEQFSNKYGPGEHAYGRLIWFAADGRFYDADGDEESEEVLPQGDALIKQLGSFSEEFAKLGPQ